MNTTSHNFELIVNNSWTKSISTHLPVPPDMLTVRFHTKLCFCHSGNHPWIPGKIKCTFSIWRQYWNNDKVIDFIFVIKMQNSKLNINLCPIMRYLLCLLFPGPLMNEIISMAQLDMMEGPSFLCTASHCATSFSPSQTAVRESRNTPSPTASPLLWSTHAGRNHYVSVKEALPWKIIWSNRLMVCSQ